MANEEDRLAAANTAAVLTSPLLFDTTAAAGDDVMMLLLLRYERCTITNLPPRMCAGHEECHLSPPHDNNAPGSQPR